MSVYQTRSNSHKIKEFFSVNKVVNGTIPSELYLFQVKRIVAVNGKQNKIFEMS